MPPRLQRLSQAAIAAVSRPIYQPLAPFLYPLPGQRQHRRNASILTSLSDVKAAYNKKIRRGRGPSSGKGKTSGRGHKGQKQHGKVPAGFNGGQTPDEVVAGKRGFENPFSAELSPVNLNRIQYWINAGRLDPTQPITLRELTKSRCIHGIKKDGVKLLARGKEELTSPINIVVSRASAEAINAIEKVGGTVMTRYYTRFAIQKILRGEMNPIDSIQSRMSSADGSEESAARVAEEMAQDRLQYKYRLPDPSSRKAIEYYRDRAHRGYLSYLVPEGQGPSLFFKTPREGGAGRQKVSKKGGQGANMAENRLWG